jgi:hypothetical protein
MRVFYVDEDIPQPPRHYYVKIDNIIVPDELKGFRVIKAATAAELKDRIYEVYNFNETAKKHIQLWSGPIGVTNRIRLDTLVHIPKEYEEIYVRGVANNTME